MREVLKTGGLVVLMTIGTIGPIWVMKTIEAARAQARRTQCKNTIRHGLPMYLEPPPADATRPEN